MIEGQDEILVAVGLMRRALALLDAAKEQSGAPQLQLAIDRTLGARPLRPGEELPPEFACSVAAIPLEQSRPLFRS